MYMVRKCSFYQTRVLKKAHVLQHHWKSWEKPFKILEQTLENLEIPRKKKLEQPRKPIK